MVPNILMRNVWLMLLCPMQVLGQGTNNGLPFSDIDKYHEDWVSSNGNNSDISNIARNSAPFVNLDSPASYQGTPYSIGAYSQSIQVISSPVVLGSTDTTSAPLFSSMKISVRSSEASIMSRNDRFSLTRDFLDESTHMSSWASSTSSMKASAGGSRNLVTEDASSWGRSKSSISIDISLLESIKDFPGIMSSTISKSSPLTESDSVRFTMSPSTLSIIFPLSSLSTIPTTYSQSPIAGKMNELRFHIHRSNSESPFLTISSFSVAKIGNLALMTPSFTGSASSSVPNTMKISGTATSRSSVVFSGTLSIPDTPSHTPYSYAQSRPNILNKVSPNSLPQVSMDHFSTTSNEYSSYNTESIGNLIHTSSPKLPSKAKNTLIPNSNSFVGTTELSTFSSTSNILKLSSELNYQSSLASSTSAFIRPLTGEFTSEIPSRTIANTATSREPKLDTFPQRRTSPAFIDSSATKIKATSSKVPMPSSGISHISPHDESAMTAISLDSPVDATPTYLPKTVSLTSHPFVSPTSSTDGSSTQSSASPKTRSPASYTQTSTGYIPMTSGMTSRTRSGISHDTWSEKSPTVKTVSSELGSDASSSTCLPKEVTSSSQTSVSLTSHPFISPTSSTDGSSAQSSAFPETRSPASYTQTSTGYIPMTSGMTSRTRSGISHDTWSDKSPAVKTVSSELGSDTSDTTSSQTSVSLTSHPFISPTSSTDGSSAQSSASPKTRSPASYTQTSTGYIPMTSGMTSRTRSGISHDTWSDKSPAVKTVSSELGSDASSSTYLPKEVTSSSQTSVSLTSHPFISPTSSTDGSSAQSSAFPETRSPASYTQTSTGYIPMTSGMTSRTRSGISHDTWSDKSPTVKTVSSELGSDTSDTTSSQTSVSLTSHPFISPTSSTDGSSAQSSASPETRSPASYTQTSTGYIPMTSGMTSRTRSGISHDTWSDKSPAVKTVSSELGSDASSSTYLPKEVTSSSQTSVSLSSHPFVSPTSSTDEFLAQSSASPKTRSPPSYTQTSSGNIPMTSGSGFHGKPSSTTIIRGSKSSHLNLASSKSSSNIISATSPTPSVTSIERSSKTFEGGKGSKMERSSLPDTSESSTSKSTMASVLNGHPTYSSESANSQKTISISSPLGLSSLEEHISSQVSTQSSKSMMNSFSENPEHLTKTFSSKCFQTLCSSSNTVIREGAGSISSTSFSPLNPPRSSKTSLVASTLISESATMSPVFSETSVVSSPSNTNWLPYSIIVEPSHSVSATHSFNPNVTATLPYAITPQTPVSEPSDSSVITVGFKRQLNYGFLMNTPLSSAQIFAFLPDVLVYPFNFDHTGEAIDNKAFSAGNRKRTILEPYHDVRVKNNKMNILKIIDPSNVKVIQIIPMTTEEKDYLVSIAEVYFPRHHIKKLKQYVKTPTSRLYANPDPTLSALADLIDPSILLTGLLDGEGNISNGRPKEGDSGSSSHSSTNDGSYTSENWDNGSLQSPNSTSHISNVITKRLAIFLNCFAFGSLLWILCFLVTLGKMRQVLLVKECEEVSDSDTAFEILKLHSFSGEVSTSDPTSTLQIFYEKSPSNANRDYSKRQGTNNVNTVSAWTDSNKDPTSSQPFSYSDDLIVTGENTVYNILHGLQYFVDEDGQFFYAGNGYSSKGNDSTNNEGSLLDSLDNYMYAESEEIAMPLTETDMSDLEVDEEGNFVLVNDEMFDNIQNANDSCSKKKASHTVESYNNNRMYKFTGASSDHVFLSGEGMSRMVQRHNDTDDEYILSDSADSHDWGPTANGDTCPPSMTTGSIENTSSNGLSNLPSDLDQYIYQECESEDPIFSEWDDINIEDIDDDKVADLEIDGFDELDEEMYQRLSKLMRERTIIGKKSMVQSNVDNRNFKHTDLSSPPILASASVPFIGNNGRAFDGKTKTAILERNPQAANAGGCRSTKPEETRYNGVYESKKLKISAPICSRNSLGW